jgi:alanine racemase
MNREGIQPQHLTEFIKLVEDAPQITLEGVMSHFANADEPDSSFNTLQIENFKHMYATIETLVSTTTLEKIVYRHIANSA